MAVLLALSVILQLVAAVMACKLIGLTKERAAWGLMAAVAVLMAVRRAMSLVHLLEPFPSDTDIYSEIIAVAISLLIVVGMSRIAPVFSSLKKAEASLQRQLTFTETLLEALRQSEWKYRLMVDTAREGILALGPDCLISFVNARMTEMLDFGSDEIIGRPLTDFMFEEDIPDQLMKIEGRRLGRSETYERRLRCRDGRVIWAMVSASPILDMEGHFGGSFGMFTDITEMRQTEQALRESEAKHRIVAENTYDWEFWLNPEGTFIYISPSCERITGHAPEQFHTDPGLQDRIVHPDDFSGFAMHRHSAGQANPGMLQYRIIRPDGTTVWIEHACQPVFDPNGAFLGTRGSNRDITDRKRAEQALREEERCSRSLVRLSRRLERAQTYKDVINAALDEVESVIGYRNMSVYVLSEDKTHASCLVAGGAVIWDDRSVAIQVSGHAMMEEMLEAEDIVIVADAGSETGIDKEAVARLGLRTSVNIPVVLFEKRRGWVSTGSFGDEGVIVPTSSQEEFLRALASHMAVSLDRIHLLERRRKAEEHLAERVMLAELSAEIGCSLSQQEKLPIMLRQCAEALVRHLDAAFARVWTLNPAENVLELQASAGMYTHVNGSHSRVPVGSLKIGAIAESREPHITNSVVGDPQIHDQEWAKREGMVSFAGHPLIVNDKLVGVMALFSRNILPDATLRALASVASEIAIGIERKQTEEALRKSDAFIKNILESVDEGFAVIDRDFRVLSVNRAYVRLCGCADNVTVGGHCYQMVHRLDKPCYDCGRECPARKVFTTGEPSGALHKEDSAGGKPVFLEIRAYPMKDDVGNVISVIEIVVDVTEKTKLEQQLHHAQKMEAVGALAGGVAHDFNNILTAIIGYSDLVKMNMGPDSSQLPIVDQLLASAKRAANLTQGLLAFSRKQAIEPRRVDLNDIVRNVEKLLRRLIGEDIDFTTRLTPKNIVAMADPGQIEQVLMNLATNARDAMPGGGRLVLTTQEIHVQEGSAFLEGVEKAGRYALLTVADSGAGMDEPTREKIFEPFFTTKGVERGTGLGLSIVYGIVKQHNGHISCHSDPGRGTTFRIFLPLVATDADEVHPEAELPPRGGTETILFAEDDQDVRTLLISYLTTFGYRVIEAADGEEAIEKFARYEKEIDLVILDVIMPRKSGKEVYDVIKSARPELETLFISGYTADIIHKKGIYEEGLNFISKPVSSFDLLRKIREMLD